MKDMDKSNRKWSKRKEISKGGNLNNKRNRRQRKDKLKDIIRKMKDMVSKIIEKANIVKFTERGHLQKETNNHIKKQKRVKALKVGTNGCNIDRVRKHVEKRRRDKGISAC